MSVNDTEEEFGVEAPRPVDAESVARGSFKKLSHGQGAKHAAAATRSEESEHEESVPISKRTLIIVIVAAVVIIAVAVVLFIRVLDAPSRAAQNQPEVERTAVTTDQTISNRGCTYSLEQGENGVYRLLEIHSAENGQVVPLGEIKGTPVSLALFDGTILIPENLSDGSWDVPAFTIGVGWGQMKNQDGSNVGGKGTVTEARLDGSKLVVVVDGKPMDVPLTW